MIKGVITTKDVLANSFTIVQCFGLSCLLRCCEAVLWQQQTTFLACVYPRRRVVAGRERDPNRSV